MWLDGIWEMVEVPPSDGDKFVSDSALSRWQETGAMRCTRGWLSSVTV